MTTKDNIVSIVAKTYKVYLPFSEVKRRVFKKYSDGSGSWLESDNINAIRDGANGIVLRCRDNLKIDHAAYVKASGLDETIITIVSQPARGSKFADQEGVEHGSMYMQVQINVGLNFEEKNESNLIEVDLDKETLALASNYLHEVKAPYRMGYRTKQAIKWGVLGTSFVVWMLIYLGWIKLW